MNFRLVARQLGLLLIVLSIILGSIAVWALIEWRWGGQAEELEAMQALFSSALAGGLGGALVWLIARRPATAFSRREALFLVAMSWFVGAGLAALPYVLWAHFADTPGDQPFRRFINCYFEAMSGLTTTGSTILSDIELIPRSLLLWRATTHWLGGLGIVVLFVAVLPSLGVRGKRLFRVEAPGPDPEGVRPHAYDTARILWLIYLGITIIAVLSLRATGAMGWFDAICHGFSTVSTGGLSPYNASIEHYDSLAVELIIAFFMLVVGVNFALYYQMARGGRLRSIWRDPELRLYLVLKVLGFAVIAWTIAPVSIETTAGLRFEPSTGMALRSSMFTTIAMHTGTGFCVSDYDQWPTLSLIVIFGLAFVGGCAGSTAGGVKVIRLWITLKVLVAELERTFRPNVVRPLKLGGNVLEPEMKLSALGYVLGLFLLFGLGAFLVSLFEPSGGRCDLLTATTASLSSICNIGPGLHGVGATRNYGWFSDGSKVVLTLLMALGRLEVFAILVMFTPRFWRAN